MTKIGLFGDSYACLTTGIGEAWFENQLILDKYQLVSFAKKGSDISWSYQEFLKNHHMFEQNIFIVTQSTRHHFELSGKRYFVSNYDTIDQILKNVHDLKPKKILNSLKDHYMYTMSIDLYDFGLAGMVERLKEIRPNTIFIYGFYNHSIEKITGSDFYLSQVSMMELEKLGVDWDWMRSTSHPEARSAHMTKENNHIFAKYVRDRLDGLDVNISLDSFVNPMPEDYGKYFPLLTRQ